ncbi:MAG: adenine methyltransferase [Candidatus Viridilinea halotolerans]|uniref:site-specific DNA-methyltransferase (adenine-specific) n=1 Tax=Candidatus Viridilinea halotolerans TaxID=2491704 RepID=A0A426U3P1_9CHLR|nr:MAG: adenine methyltransferase [Candidatus Viridilinea halotolerans]
MASLTSTQQLLEQVDLVRLRLGANAARRSTLGQVFTPAPLARLMAGLIAMPHQAVHLIDPGAGLGTLTAAAVEALCQRTDPPETISVTACEIDAALTPYLAATLAACATYCKQFGIAFEAKLVVDDFLHFATQQLAPMFDQPESHFNLALLNPPYRKIQTTSHERRLLSQFGIEVSNVYAGFVALCIKLLRPNGELVAITPRSFCNGPYFRPFRKFLLDHASLRSFYLFDTRQEAFRDAAVLQETVITTAIVGGVQQPTLHIITAHSPSDEMPTVQEVAFAQVVHPADRERFIHLVTNQASQAVVAQMQHLTATLADLGLTVSTGRVVDFRATEYLRDEPSTATVPLLYPTHCEHGQIVWPKAGKKPNAIVYTAATQALFVPNEIYVLIKRFSAKEERRRIVATLFHPDRVASEWVAFENHLNYIHCQGAGLKPDIASGLTAYLNSTLVDTAFRHFNGHTQVNATDLRTLRYPSREQLIALGTLVQPNMEQAQIDELVAREVFSMHATSDPNQIQKRIREALDLLKLLGLPRAQQNERSALTLLALLNIKPDTPWRTAQAPLCGITPMMAFFATHYGRTYAPNTRETVRRQTVHQLLEAGFVLANPDQPDRPVNSPKAVYQIEPRLLTLLQSFGSVGWEANLEEYLASIQTLRVRYARERSAKMLNVQIAEGQLLYLTPGGQNELVKLVLEEFRPRFAPESEVLYVGDAGKKFALFRRDELAELGVVLDEHGKMPDVIMYDATRHWLFLIEAVTSHGPIDGKRHDELSRLFTQAKVGLVFVTAFLDRKGLQKELSNISWETEVWIADAPSHLIHFDGDRFLGPYGGDV